LDFVRGKANLCWISISEKNVPLQVKDVFAKLSEWPHRGVGSENEMEAREALITELSGEFEVEISEEGFDAPPSYVRFLWSMGLTAMVALFWANVMPSILALAGGVAFINIFLFFDGRFSPLIWWGARETTANLVATKGAGRRLIILMAHLDSAPASFVFRPGQIAHFRLSIWIAMGIFGLAVLFPLLASFGASIDLVTLGVSAALIFGLLVFLSVDFWRFGYAPGANDNLSGVAAATSAASHLWRLMPKGCEVRLVITSAKETGMLGAQHYWQTHRTELKQRETFVLNLDTVGCKNLSYVVESGGFTMMKYDNQLSQTANNLTQLNQQFTKVTPARHETGCFDTIWFHRDGFPVLTLASYDNEGYMTAVHTPDDTPDKLNFASIQLAALFAESIVRMMPSSTRDNFDDHA
jgi:hypothetical protein